MSPAAILIPACVILLTACKVKTTNNADTRRQTKQEVVQAEKDFAAMAAERGIAEAFWFFADSNAVIRRQHDSLIFGKEGIRKYYSEDHFRKARVTWSPDFVEVSPDGLLAYTYGKYVWQSTDSAGTVSEAKGIFHTVWKKQRDNSWKYVWD